MDDVTIGQVLGTFSSLDNMNCAGLVAHLKETNNVYPAVLNNRGKPPPVLNNHGQPIDSDLTWAEWARGWYDKWLDPKAIDPQAAKQGFWP